MGGISPSNFKRVDGSGDKNPRHLTYQDILQQKCNRSLILESLNFLITHVNDLSSNHSVNFNV